MATWKPATQKEPTALEPCATCRNLLGNSGKWWQQWPVCPLGHLDRAIFAGARATRKPGAFDNSAVPTQPAPPDKLRATLSHWTPMTQTQCTGTYHQITQHHCVDTVHWLIWLLTILPAPQAQFWPMWCKWKSMMGFLAKLSDLGCECCLHPSSPFPLASHNHKEKFRTIIPWGQQASASPHKATK